MQRLPGFRDFYPEPLPQLDVWSADARQYIFDKWRTMARRYGFREYDGPPIEPLELYTTKSGEEIVGQLYNFIDKGERAVSLRPEMTPTLARMAAAHERNYKKPIKWFAIPQLFRYEKQQKGRLREHFQFNADVIGETDTAADAELIALLIDTLRSFGLTEQDFVIRLSSRNAWHEFFQARQPDTTKEYAFYQAIDKMERDTPENNQQKLAALGFTLADVTAFIEAGKPTAELQSILDNLAARNMASFVKIDYGVIRGLAYYTGTVFEAFDRKGEFRAIAGGGRYDNLIKLIHGKVDLPAQGFGMGDVVLLELLKSRKLLPAFRGEKCVFFFIPDETLRPDTLRWIQQVRDWGFPVEYTFTPTKEDKQFKRMRDLNAKVLLRLEKDEAGSLRLRYNEVAAREPVYFTPADGEALRARIQQDFA